MSVILHRCADCGHLEHWHKPGTGEYEGDDHRAHMLIKAPEPELVRTWDTWTGEEITALTTPGSRWLGRQLCHCPACLALAELAA